MQSVQDLLDMGRSCRVHMIGIGGAGMEPLARLLQEAGHVVQGSDQMESALVGSLRSQGIHVWTGEHDASRIDDADFVVYSAAVNAVNPELQAARARTPHVCSRAQLLGALSQQRPTIAVAGTHGKTTTASMIAAVARAAGEDPGVVIGGWQTGNSQAATGRDGLLVAEADEYDRSFLTLHPMGAVVTNIEADHHDTYADNEALDTAFASFLGQASEWIVTHDEARCTRAASTATAAVTLCGHDETSQIQLEEMQVEAEHCHLRVRVDGESRPSLQLAARGQHNVDNALMVIGVADRMNWSWAAIDDGLTNFAGVDRRLQTKATMGGTLVVDDYAHHPTEVAAALRWAHQTKRRVVAVFQPHLYSRTRHLQAEFVDALSLADEVWVCDIYPAREAPIEGVTLRLLTEPLRNRLDVVFEEHDASVAIGAALDRCADGDLLLVMGAGDIGDRLDAILSSRRAANEA
jgi:UDP-N-acetylmuramate--alanine ligase